MRFRRPRPRNVVITLVVLGVLAVFGQRLQLFAQTFVFSQLPGMSFRKSATDVKGIQVKQFSILQRTDKNHFGTPV